MSREQQRGERIDEYPRLKASQIWQESDEHRCDLRDQCAMFFMVHRLGRDCAIVVNRMLERSYAPDMYNHIYDWHSPAMVMDWEYQRIKNLVYKFEYVESNIQRWHTAFTMRDVNASIGRLSRGEIDEDDYRLDSAIIPRLRYEVATMMQLKIFAGASMEPMRQRMGWVVGMMDHLFPR